MSFRFTAYRAALAGVASCMLAPGANAQDGNAPEKPNIILMISDDHRWDGLGIAGNKYIKTPNLDRMAREGQWYREATIQVPTCTASRASILTGLPPSEHGFYSNNWQRADVLNPHGFDKYEVLPEQLQQAGYHTAFAGKWHLSADPWLVGFETIKHWMLPGAGPYRNPKLATGRSRETRVTNGYTQTIFANDALEILDAKASGETTQPLFLWLAFTAPHDRFGPNPKPFDGMYDNKTASELAPETFHGDPNARDKGETWKKYYEAISALDAEVGRVMDKVRNSSLSTNTLVVFIGDNGFMMGARNMWGKYVPYEGALRVPMIAWGPDRIVGAKGSTVTAAANSIDLPPTFVKLAGGTPPGSWVGRDITAVLKDGKPHDITWAVSQYPDHKSPMEHVKAYRVIRTPEYKLIHFHPDSGQGHELYDLKKDPAEKNNLYGKPQVAEVQKSLEKRLGEFRQKSGDTGWDMKGEVVSFRQLAKQGKVSWGEDSDEDEEQRPRGKKARRQQRQKQQQNQ